MAKNTMIWPPEPQNPQNRHFFGNFSVQPLAKVIFWPSREKPNFAFSDPSRALSVDPICGEWNGPLARFLPKPVPKLSKNVKKGQKSHFWQNRPNHTKSKNGSFRDFGSGPLPRPPNFGRPRPLWDFGPPGASKNPYLVGSGHFCKTREKSFRESRELAEKSEKSAKNPCLRPFRNWG